MAIQVFTARGLDALKPQATRYEIFDALTPGLAIRVTPSGHKSWVLLLSASWATKTANDRTISRSERWLMRAPRLIRERGRILDGADPAMEKHDERATLRRHGRCPLRPVQEGDREEAQLVGATPHFRTRSAADVAARPRPGRHAARTSARSCRRRRRRRRPWPTGCWRASRGSSVLPSSAIGSTANPAFRIMKPADERSRDRVLSRDELRELWAALHQTEARHPDGMASPDCRRR